MSDELMIQISADDLADLRERLAKSLHSEKHYREMYEWERRSNYEKREEFSRERGFQLLWNEYKASVPLVTELQQQLANALVEIESLRRQLADRPSPTGEQ